jgi:hypothetical protein
LTTGQNCDRTGDDAISAEDGAGEITADLYTSGSGGGAAGVIHQERATVYFRGAAVVVSR